MRSRNTYLYVALAVLTAVVYWQVQSHGFVAADDTEYITKNPIVQEGLTWKGVAWAFTTGYTGYAHPLTWLSLMLDCQLFGLNAGRHHIVSVFIHLINSLLLFAVLKKMTNKVWPSFFVAAVFALHPAHIESVAWAAERKDVLSTLFFMLTIMAYTSYSQKGTKLRYVLVLLCFILGIMAKPMLVTLPVVLLLLDYWPLERLRPAANNNKRHRNKDASKPGKTLKFLILEKLPLFAVSACSSAITFYFQKVTGAAVRPDILPFDIRFSNAMISYAKYIIKFFWPANLSFLYPYPALPLPQWQIILSVLLLLSIWALVFKLHRLRYMATGWLWFLITLVPVIGFVQVGVQAMADRYTYVPYIGLSIMVAWAFSDLAARRKYTQAVLIAVTVIAISAMGLSTFFQLGYWKNTTTLFSHAAEVTGNYRLSLMAKNNQAWILATSANPNERNPAEAIRIATEINRETGYSDPAFLDTLGVAYASIGRFDEAIKMGEKALNSANRTSKDLLSMFQRHLDLYKASKPYVESQEKYKIQ